MAAGRFEIKISTEEVQALADTLGAIDEGTLGVAAMRSVNEVAERTYATARGKMISGIGLTEGYVDERMKFEPATVPINPTAFITARYRHTTLGTYGAKQLTQATKHPKRSKGDARLGIAPGAKSAGISVEVTRGSRKPISYAFFMPMRAGNASGGNGMGMFKRTGDGPKDYEPMYGPSVYQLFRATVSGIFDDIEADLRETVGASVAAELQKALT